MVPKRTQCVGTWQCQVARMGATGRWSASARHVCHGARNTGGQATSGTQRRRGTVLIMVIGVLSMLFMVGASLLIVGRFERQTVETQAAGRDLEMVGSAVAEPIQDPRTAKVPYDNPPQR